MANIKDIPKQERPYEKLLMYGEKTLTDSELLSIIIKTGTKEKSALEIARNLMKEAENYSRSLRFLQSMSIAELTNINGIGKVKAIELKAVGEIAKRISKPFVDESLQVNSKHDVASLFMEELQNEKSEVLKVVLLNNKNIVKKILSIAVGNEENISINIKAILSEPVKMQLSRIILVHNHPSRKSSSK